jgi:hypothetical protein
MARRAALTGGAADRKLSVLNWVQGRRKNAADQSLSAHGF